jgi:hypothetical protein
MRIFFIQKAWGLFASSGEYRANLSFLRHFTNLGHSTVQLCFGMDGDLKSCLKEMEVAGRPDDPAKDTLNLITHGGNSISVEVSAFTNVDGIHILAVDGDKFKEAFPPEIYAQEIKDFIEVSVPLLLIRIAADSLAERHPEQETTYICRLYRVTGEVLPADTCRVQ